MILLQKYRSIYSGIAVALLGLVGIVGLAGCNKSAQETSAPPAQTAPATSGNTTASTGGAPIQTPEQKKAEQESVARSIAERQAHQPPPPK